MATAEGQWSEAPQHAQVALPEIEEHYEEEASPIQSESLPLPYHLLVFARFPHPGKVKTRLGASVGDIIATHFYRCCAERMFFQCLKCQSDLLHCTVFYAESSGDEGRFLQWMRTLHGADGKICANDFTLRAQIQSEDLGARMADAFQYAFNAQSAKKVVIVATDCPDLTIDVIMSAYELLDKHDVVVGPACDGGYYLLGMKSFHEALFQGIEWSTSTVCSRTLEIAASLNLAVASAPLLPELQDVDTLEDLKAWHQGATVVKDCPVYSVSSHILEAYYPSFSTARLEAASSSSLDSLAT